MLKLLIVAGTRPEVIKMAPLVHAAERSTDGIEPVFCLTGQHTDLADSTAAHFGVQPDIRLDAMRAGQSLSELTARLLTQLDGAIEQSQPDVVAVQGDTTSVLAATLAAFYRRLPLVHVEAGLRTGDLNAPWPEEMNRRVTSVMTNLHCAATKAAASALLREGIHNEQIVVTGNPVIDALLWTVDQNRHRVPDSAANLPPQQKVVLVTCHRRENFGPRQRHILAALLELAKTNDDVQFVFPLHPNPSARKPAEEALSSRPNFTLLEALPYPDFVWWMNRAHFVMSDSGGVQEEAPAIGKPVIVLRESTERPEAVEAGASVLVGANRARIVAEATAMLHNAEHYAQHTLTSSPYGDGSAAEQIIREVVARFATADKSQLVLPAGAGRV